MPLQNRVTPLGKLVAEPGRGRVYGNRGCLHDQDGRIRRNHNGKRWIACRLEFRGWLRRPLLQPGRFTELFFLDEATAFAAGHRPCALCRHEDYLAFVSLWRGLHGGPARAEDIDAQLHRERLDGRGRRLCEVRIADLSDGAFVLHEGVPWLVLGDRLLRWTAAGYVSPIRLERTGLALAITPPSLVSVLREGWQGVVPLVHPSACID